MDNKAPSRNGTPINRQYAALFPVLYILYRAVHKNCEKYFLPAALWAGAMVMVHTHSFLALGLICGVWLFFVLAAGVLNNTVACHKA